VSARQPWTAEEEDLVRDLFDRGFGYEHVARRLGRTEKAVLIRVKRRRLGGMRNTRGVMSATQASRLLGLDVEGQTVRRWVARSWLKARVLERGPHRYYRITWEQLAACLSSPQTWPSWEPGRITDLGTRLWAEEMRAGQPGWVPIGEAARRIGVTASAVNYHCRRGAVEAVQWGNWYVRETSVTALAERLRTPVRHVGEKARVWRSQ
jgi:hypothetical protein